MVSLFELQRLHISQHHNPQQAFVLGNYYTACIITDAPEGHVS